MPFFCLLGRLGCGGSGGCAFLRLGLAGYGVMITPHGLLDLLEVRTVLVSVREEEQREEAVINRSHRILRECIACLI